MMLLLLCGCCYNALFFSFLLPLLIPLLPILLLVFCSPSQRIDLILVAMNVRGMIVVVVAVLAMQLWIVNSVTLDDNGHVKIIVVERSHTSSCDHLKNGDEVVLNVVGVLAESNEVFTRDDEMHYTIGSETFIPGWEYGLEGVCEGEKRTVVIPPALAYGEHGHSPVVPPHAELKFHIQVVEIIGHSSTELKHFDLDMIALFATAFASAIIIGLCFKCSTRDSPQPISAHKKKGK
eukprot:m.8118 g.8118  ORF g.8118 m.8118 type:complete len:235 (+) comp3020_c0_seq1:59-763(+)